MRQKTYIRVMLVIALGCVSAAGLWVHLLVHPLGAKAVNIIPFFSGLISVVAVSAFFFFRRLVPFAYIINGMLVIIGTITMVHFSIKYFPTPFEFSLIFQRTLLPDIVILWTAFFIGKALFELEMTNPTNMDAPRHKGRFFRYPNMGYWFAHLAGLSVVYTLGYMLWK